MLPSFIKHKIAKAPCTDHVRHIAQQKLESSTMVDKQQRPKKAQSTAIFLLAILLLIGLTSQWLDISIIAGMKKFMSHDSAHIIYRYPEDFDCSLNCSQIAPPNVTLNKQSTPYEECPEFFKWIHEDLKLWKKTGVTREMTEKAKTEAEIRITIVDGRLYVSKYKDVFQTRDAVTIWGLLQLLRLYPGRVPDVDLMLGLGDRPVIVKSKYGGLNASMIPPLLHYCGDDGSFDIVFPDWSFWGWPEVNIKPWEELKEDIEEGNGRMKWEDREPYAFWKGNSKLSFARVDLAKCNTTDEHDWKAQILEVDWIEEKKHGFKSSNLATQCTHRYKIYVEGVAWSVSQKYILACDSMTLLVKPHFYDFFTRSLVPTVHYWPINRRTECESIKFAVEWGNKNTDKAREIGKRGSNFVQENLAMKNVYDYTFHLLNEYAKLLKYKPTVPEEAVETCSEALMCSVKGAKRRFRKHSMVKSPSDSPPCVLPPPYEEEDVRAFFERKENLRNDVISWERSGSAAI